MSSGIFEVIRQGLLNGRKVKISQRSYQTTYKTKRKIKNNGQTEFKCMHCIPEGGHNETTTDEQGQKPQTV